MLKIKDNVDLKELEKFGFEDSKTSQNVPYEYWDYDKDYHFDNTYFVFIASGRRGQDYYLLINKETRKLVIYATKPDGDGTSGDLENAIYDLIKADLVEKVDEND
jgi:hypothetical protein